MAKAIVRFGFAGSKRACVELSIKDAARMAEAMDFVHGNRESLSSYVKATRSAFFTVSRRNPRNGVNCPNGFYVEVEYVPAK